ncbi:unnamed protein product, partial [Coregonus sp. 'balchen']
MLRGPDMLKNRCCVLFGDLKVLLLRPPAPVTIPIPMTGHIPDSRETGVPSDVSIPDNDTLRAHQGPGDKWTAPAPGGASGLERDRPGWVDATAAEPSGILHCSSSSKDRLEQRFSLCSYGDSGGIRSPVCRICFQGPETGELLSPCRCSGSVRCTHQPCLIKWISERGSWASVLGSMFLVASLSWLVWSSFSPSARWQRHDLLFQICYGMYGFMDIVCFGEAEPHSSLQPWLTDNVLTPKSPYCIEGVASVDCSNLCFEGAAGRQRSNLCFEGEGLAGRRINLCFRGDGQCSIRSNMLQGEGQLAGRP